jgi:hypothetical protein
MGLSAPEHVERERLNFRPVQDRFENRLGSANTLYETVTLSFVIPNEALRILHDLSPWMGEQDGAKPLPLLSFLLDHAQQADHPRISAEDRFQIRRWNRYTYPPTPADDK